MKKFQKVAAVTLASMLAIGALAGCGATTQTTGGEAEKTEGATEEKAEETATAEATSEGGVFKIGSIGPMTGDGAAYGLAVVQSTQLAAEEINAAGGINGYMVEVQVQDDELDNEKSMNAYNALKDWGMQMLVGPTTSGCTIAVSDLANADNMFLLTPSGTALDCVK